MEGNVAGFFFRQSEPQTLVQIIHGIFSSPVFPGIEFLHVPEKAVLEHDAFLRAFHGIDKVVKKGKERLAVQGTGKAAARSVHCLLYDLQGFLGNPFYHPAVILKDSSLAGYKTALHVLFFQTASNLGLETQAPSHDDFFLAFCIFNQYEIIIQYFQYLHNPSPFADMIVTDIFIPHKPRLQQSRPCTSKNCLFYIVSFPLNQTHPCQHI